MSVPTLNAEQKAMFDQMVELEKRGGSAAFLQAMESAPMLLHHALNNNEKPLGLDPSIPITRLKIWGSSGTIHLALKTKDGHICTGSGVGYVSKDIDILGDLHYVTLGVLFSADAFDIASNDESIFLYFSASSIPAGFIKAVGEPGTKVVGRGSCTWTQG